MDRIQAKPRPLAEGTALQGTIAEKGSYPRNVARRTVIVLRARQIQQLSELAIIRPRPQVLLMYGVTKTNVKTVTCAPLG